MIVEGREHAYPRPGDPAMQHVRATPPPGWRGWRVRVADYLGIKGFVLIVVGLAWILQGYNVHTNAQGSAVTVSPAFDTFALPEELRAFLWVAAGIVGISSAFVLTPRLMGIGFAALFIGPAQRSLSFLTAWGAELWNGSGVPGAWAPAMIWGVLALVLMAVARVTEDSRFAPRNHYRGR